MPRARSAVLLRRLLILAVVGLLAVALAPSIRAGSDTRELASAWRDRDIRIDGNDEDWRDLTSPVKGQRFAVGLLNDGESLYLCLVTRDRVTVTQIARQGLMVWLTAAGQKKHAFGIHFPIDGVRRSATVQGREPEDAPPPSDVPEGQDAVGILGPGRNDSKRVTMIETGGLLARAAIHGDVLVYEMKVPLRRSQWGPYAVNAEPGSSLRMELQTPEWRGPLMPVARTGPVGIGVGVGPGPGGRGMIGYPPVDLALLRPMDLAATVKLATEGK
jgi:hypothetical protein